jgi:hypothetical protein
VLKIINVLTASLVVYISLIENGDFDLAALVSAAGVRCSRCGTGACAVLHSKWYRKQVTDLSTGAIYRQVPILRVIFCDGSSPSLKHAELWRGRYTVSSVLETTIHVLAHGLNEALEWTMYSGGGEQMVSERTLRRWTRRVVPRLGPLSDYLGLVAPPEAVTPAEKLAWLLDRIEPADLLRFRTLTGYGLLDKPAPEPKTSHSTARPRPGHLRPAPPHNPPSRYLPRGSRYGPHRSKPPPEG